jgi:excisionase family DNA binding protein
MSPPQKRDPVPLETEHRAGQSQLATGNLQQTGLTIKEASWHFSVHRKTVERWINTGRLKVHRLPSGRARVILEAAK